MPSLFIKRLDKPFSGQAIALQCSDNEVISVSGDMLLALCDREDNKLPEPTKKALKKMSVKLISADEESAFVNITFASGMEIQFEISSSAKRGSIVSLAEGIMLDLSYE